jgi:hypothetical protein
MLRVVVHLFILIRDTRVPIALNPDLFAHDRRAVRLLLHADAS